MEKLPVLKVIIAGDENVGKTSLVRRFCEGKFEISRVTTIGVDFQTQTVQLPEERVKLSIWDMAGQERFRFLRQDFYRGALATALVFDVTNQQSLVNLKRWSEDVSEIEPGQKFIAVGNKIDLQRSIEPATAQAFVSSMQVPYMETSALSGDGVSEFFNKLALIAYTHFISKRTLS